MKRVFIVLMMVMIVMVSSSWAQKKKKNKEPGMKDWSAYDFTKHFSYKNGGGKKDLLKNKRVFISDFRLSQVVLANGKQMGESNFAKMTVNLGQIDKNAYLDLAAKLYAQLVDRLKAEGYEIVSDEEVAQSDFVKKEHNGKNIFCVYTDENLMEDKDQFGNEMVLVRPLNKFIVVNNKKIVGTWPVKFARAIGANVISVNMVVNFVGFDGSRRTGYKGGPSIEAGPYLSVYPWVGAMNERGGLWIFPNAVAGNTHWVGPNGIEKTSGTTSIFGSAKGTYVMDVNQEVYLAEVGAVAAGLSKGFISSMMNEIK